MTDVAARPNGAARDDHVNLEDELNTYRRELTGYCYRMFGSAFEAEDAVQETMVRAWRSFDKFEGRASVRSWLYRIATNVCLDMVKHRQRRARPMDMEAPSTIGDATIGPPLAETTWVQPIPDGRVVPDGGDPADLAESRQSIRLAFVAALQHLPPRQRAVLILREVLRWKASEVAELLDTTVVSVNSTLQRARAALAQHGVTEDRQSEPSDEEERELLSRYVDAFERYDMDALVALLHEDATLTMPPYSLWLRGHEDIVGWMLGPGCDCEGSRLVPVAANGQLAFGQYRPSGPNGEHEPWALQVIETSDGRITGLVNYLDTSSLDRIEDTNGRQRPPEAVSTAAEMFVLFGLPERLDPADAS